MTTAFPDPVRATVVAGSQSVDYLVAGSGPPIVLLATPSRRIDLINQLRQSHRVICPMLESPIGADGRTDWLTDFLDGLGLDEFAIVVDQVWAPMASALSDRVTFA